MSVLNPIAFAGAAVGTANVTTAAGNLPANCAIYASVTTHHLTPASLADPTVTDTGGVAVWVAVSGGNRTFADAGSGATRRHKIFRTMVAADQVGVTISAIGNGIAQNGISINVVIVEGVDIGGANGADSVVAIYGADSANASVTALAVAMSAFANPNNGAVAFFYSGTNAVMAPKTGWTELLDVGVSGTRHQAQYITKADTTGNTTASSAPMSGFVIEVAASTQFSVASRSPWYGSTLGNGAIDVATGAPLAGIFRFTLRAGELNILVVGKDNGVAFTPTNDQGVTWNLISSLVNTSSCACWWAEFTSDRDFAVDVTFNNASPSNVSMYYVAGVDMTAAAGAILQSKTATGSANTTVTFDNALASRDSNVLVIVGVRAGSVVQSGNQSLAFQMLPANNSGNLVTFTVALKKAGAATWSISVAGQHMLTMLELAPLLVEAAPSPPVVTVISPLPYNDADPAARIAATTHLVVQVTDPDAEPGDPGGLRRVVPVIVFPDAPRSLGVQVVHNGDEFYPLFEGSTRTPITGGWEYDLIWWDGRWPSKPRVLPFAFDTTGLEAA